MVSLSDMIAAFIADHQMSERRFGELALNDKNFVMDLRAGRSPSLKTVARVQHFIASYRPDAPQDAAA